MLEHPKADATTQVKSASDITMDNQHPLEIDLSWLAAVIEGEGCITIERGGKERRNGDRCLNPSVCIANTNADFISAVVAIFDRIGIPCHVSPKTRKEGWKPAFNVRTRGQNYVGKLLRLIEPYMRSKRGQLQLVLRFIESRRQYEKPRTVPYSDYERSIVGDIRKLNQRGVRDCTSSTEQSVQGTVHTCNESTRIN